MAKWISVAMVTFLVTTDISLVTWCTQAIIPGISLHKANAVTRAIKAVVVAMVTVSFPSVTIVLALWLGPCPAVATDDHIGVVP